MTDSKEFRTRQKIAAGQRSRALLDSPIVKEHIERTRERLIADMIDAAPMDDEGRRSAALKLQALNEIVNLLEMAVAEGRHAMSEDSPHE